MAKALGRGLEALLGSLAPTEGTGEQVARVAVEKIRPNRFQPRVHFDPAKLDELADSIRRHGLAQPLLVSPSAVPGEFELVAGERRLRAAKLAGLTEVPCVVRTVNERQRHELSLVENLQREDLNPLEEAESLRRLIQDHALTQEELAGALGCARSSVANKLRLLDLPVDFQRALREGRLTEGHARALLAVEDPALQQALGLRILNEGLSVREAERQSSETRPPTQRRSRRPVDAQVRSLEEELQRALGRRVRIQSRRNHQGWVEMEFYSLEDFELLLGRLKTPPTT